VPHCSHLLCRCHVFCIGWTSCQFCIWAWELFNKTVDKFTWIFLMDVRTIYQGDQNPDSGSFLNTVWNSNTILSFTRCQHCYNNVFNAKLNFNFAQEIYKMQHWQRFLFSQCLPVYCMLICQLQETEKQFHTTTTKCRKNVPKKRI